MKRETPMPEMVAPDQWNSENGAIVQVIKWLNTFHTSSTHFNREELQSLVDQAAEKFGITASPQFFFLIDASGDMWTWDALRERWNWLDLPADGFDEGVEWIQKTYGIED